MILDWPLLHRLDEVTEFPERGSFTPQPQSVHVRHVLGLWRSYKQNIMLDNVLQSQDTSMCVFLIICKHKNQYPVIIIFIINTE